MKTEFKQFSTGSKVFCDFPFGGKPRGKVVEVLQAGNGRDNNGRVRVQISETIGAYRKGETVEVSTFQAVPVEMERKLKAGEYFRRVSTLYAFTESEVSK